jgi:hypothetical protein
MSQRTNIRQYRIRPCFDWSAPQKILGLDTGGGNGERRSEPGQGIHCLFAGHPLCEPILALFARR